MQSKTCQRCKAEKPVTEYYRHPKTKDGLFAYCRQCHRAAAKPATAEQRAKRAKKVREMRQENPERAARLRREYYARNRERVLRCRRDKRFKAAYGMTACQVDSWSASIGNRCQLCGDEPRGAHGRLNVDHCHSTGKVRGLLCNGCNQAIGRIKDNPELATRIAEYLEKHGGKAA